MGRFSVFSLHPSHGVEVVPAQFPWLSMDHTKVLKLPSVTLGNALHSALINFRQSLKLTPHS